MSDTEPMTATIAGLAEALKPFAVFSANVDDNGWSSSIHREAISTWFGPSDFLRARAAADVLQSLAGRGGEKAEPVQTYYTEGKDADWFEALEDAEFAKRASYAAMDIVDGDFANVENYIPVTAILSGAADRIRRLLAANPSTVEPVRVTELSWIDEGNGLARAKTAFGFSYFVSHRTNMWLGPQDDWLVAEGDPTDAAQEHYSNAFRSALQQPDGAAKP